MEALTEHSALPSPMITSASTDMILHQDSTDQSDLTSVPSDIGSTPESLNYQLSDTTELVRSSSPAPRRSKRQRKQSTRLLESENSSTDSNVRSVKRRKTSSTKLSHFGTLIESPSSASQSVKYTSSGDSTVAGKALPKSALKLLKSTAVKSSINNAEDWPESNIRGEPVLPTVAHHSHSEVPQDQDDTSIETDIRLSFLSKIRNQQYEPTNTIARPSDYAHRSSQHDSCLPDQEGPGRGRNKETRFVATSGAERGSNNGSAAQSPSEKAGKSSNTTKTTKGQGRLGRGKGRNASNGANGGNGGNGGRDKDSPEPNEKVAKTHDDQVLLKSVRQRQSDLKKMFLIVGLQQAEALEIMVSRDLSKMHKKSNAHTKVPEYEELLLSLKVKEDNVRSLVDQERVLREELALKFLQAQTQVIEHAFLRRTREGKAEHLKGAEGDLMILQNAHKSQVDETRTDNGSEGVTNLPLYHELPEPNARVRGYSSLRIDDERPLKEHLASYDEQAQREVIDDDIVAPVMQSVAKQNAEELAEEERKARQMLDQLAIVSEAELKRVNHRSKAKSTSQQAIPQFNLSRLADCADLMAQRERAKTFSSVPDPPKTVPESPREMPHKVPRTFPAPSIFQQSPTNPPPSLRPKSPAVRRKKTSISAPLKRQLKEEESQSQSSSNTSTPLPNIAPAPSRMPPPPMTSQHHHHHHHHMPPLSMPPPPGSVPTMPSFARHSTLAPLIIPKPQSTPPGPPIYPQGHPLSSQIPPPPSLFQSRPGPIPGPYQHHPTVSQPGLPYPPMSYPQSHFLSQRPRLPSFDQPPQRSPIEPLPPPPPPSSNPLQPHLLPQSHPQPPLPRFPLINTNASLHAPRPPPLNPTHSRRESGQITFTPTQTPSSERFTRPPGPAPQLPGRSVIRPAQLSNGATILPGRAGSIAPTPPLESRVQSAADIARLNAVKNQVQGAGPKGGRRVLLPKS